MTDAPRPEARAPRGFNDRRARDLAAERQGHHGNWFSQPASKPSGDLLAAGVELVWKMLR